MNFTSEEMMRFPENPFSLKETNMHVCCRSKLGHYEKAVEDCNAALDAQPYYTKALLRRAHSYSKVKSIFPHPLVGCSSYLDRRRRRRRRCRELQQLSVTLPSWSEHF
jgi:hypothetical protein